jgi:hypothetical protein
VSARPWIFSFTYESIAEVAKQTVRQVRRARQRGEFDPSSLASVVEWLWRVTGKREKRDDEPAP